MSYERRGAQSPRRLTQSPASLDLLDLPTRTAARRATVHLLAHRTPNRGCPSLDAVPEVRDGRAVAGVGGRPRTKLNRDSPVYASARGLPDRFIRALTRS